MLSIHVPLQTSFPFLCNEKKILLLRRELNNNKRKTTSINLYRFVTLTLFLLLICSSFPTSSCEQLFF